MGNLGAYQDIVVRAKDAGGVEMLINSIEKSAALKALPKGFAAGVVATIGAVAVVKQYTKRSKTYEAEADRAKATLAEEVSGADNGSAEAEEPTGQDSANDSDGFEDRS